MARHKAPARNPKPPSVPPCGVEDRVIRRRTTHEWVSENPNASSAIRVGDYSVCYDAVDVEHPCVVVFRHDEDGTHYLVGELYGEAALAVSAALRSVPVPMSMGPSAGETKRVECASWRGETPDTPQGFDLTDLDRE